VRANPENVSRAEALRDRMLDLKALLVTLTNDVTLVVPPTSTGDETAFRRAYVRSVFALVEGGISACSAYILEGQDSGGWVLNEATRAVLWDSVADPSGERPGVGHPSADREGWASFLTRLYRWLRRSPTALRYGRQTLVQQTKTVFTTGGRIFGQPPTADFGGSAFRAFTRAVKVRDRLVHPKRSSDLTVSDSDKRDVDAAYAWFRAASGRFFVLAVGEMSVRMAKETG
jgi:hypothetical protein